MGLYNNSYIGIVESPIYDVYENAYIGIVKTPMYGFV